jgi:CRISPR-associated protein Csx16
MLTYFVSRHPGAVEWARRRKLSVSQFVQHLEIQCIKPGDCVIGNLPLHTVSKLCEMRAVYFHLSFDMPAALRGQEVSADFLEAAGACLQAFQVSALDLLPPQASA